MKGKTYERKICRVIEAAVPGVVAHRSSQADRAWNSDIVVTGHPLLSRIWWELTDARRPVAREKLEQAERDIAAIPHASTTHLLPVVVWHRIGERTTHVTMRLDTLIRAITPDYGEHTEQSQLVTMELGQFLEVLS